MMLLPVVLLLQAASDPPARVARLSFLDGTVSLQPSGASDWSVATLNYSLTTGDRVDTDQGSRAELQVGQVAVRLSASTDLTVTNLSDHFVQLGLAQGTIRVSVYQLPADDTIEVDTPNGALTPLAAGDYRVAVSASDTSTLVSVDRGSIEVSGGGTGERVASGQAVQLTGTASIQVTDVALPSPDAFDQWSSERDRRVTTSASAQYVSRDIPGYDDLDDAGRWQVDQQYGPVWYPARVAADWVPYRYGHWVWMEPWGWTWVDDEPWGFAPFHYGRWALVGSAWGWLPGPVVARPCWAPALVVFLDGSPFARGGGAQVWFPLGPREPYFPSYHHSQDYRLRVNETNLRNATDLTDVIRRGNVNSIPYVNRRIATTVVPTATFRSGQPIARQVMRVTPDQVARAQLTPHPSAMPTVRAAAGGKAAPRPPMVARPPVVTGPPRPLTRPAPANPLPRVSPPPQVRQSPPPAGGQARQPARTPPAAGVPSGPPRVSPPPQVRQSPPPAGRQFSQPVRTPPPLIVRQQPPPAPPPFPARQQAMAAHPGRPLEPQQVQNLRAGSPAGPMRDQEVPPHPAPAPRAAPRPAPAPRPSGKRP